MPVNVYYLALLVACSAFALIWGGGPERIGITIVAANAILSFLLVSAPSARFQNIEVGVFIVDVVAFLAFIFLALRVNRFWPLWVSGLLGLGVLGHFARWAGPDVIPWAYALILEVWSYPILAIIAIGTFNHQRRRARGGDRSWSSSSAPSAPTPGPTP